MFSEPIYSAIMSRHDSKLMESFLFFFNYDVLPESRLEIWVSSLFKQEKEVKLYQHKFVCDQRKNMQKNSESLSL